MFQGSVASLVSSSESGAGMSSISSCQSNSNLSIPFHNKPKLELRTHRSNMILSSSKFQVLSPISDKSQEQSSEQGDSSSRTPKVSPTDHILASCCGVNSNNDDTENNNQVRSIKSKGFCLSRGWFPKFATELNIIISHCSKSIVVIKLSFSQNDSPIRESFWEKDSLITLLLFKLWLIMIFSPVANFGNHPLAISCQ